MGGAGDLDTAGFLRINPSELGLEAARRLEWLLPNGLGGYCSSTVLGLNTRKYHGLLVSSSGNLVRRVVLEALVEEITIGDEVHSLHVTEYADAMDARGLEHLTGFENGVNYVLFEYDVGALKVAKLIQAIPGQNAVKVSYNVRNSLDSNATFSVRPLVNSRGIHEINPMGREFKSSVGEGGVVHVECGAENIVLLPSSMESKVEGLWHRNVRYFMEAKRGEDCVEDVYSPGVFTFEVPFFSGAQALLTVASAASLDEAYEMANITGDIRLAGHGPDSLSVLRAATDSFVVDVGGVKTVVAGYHWFADWGRDTLISLPGLTYIPGRFDDAEAILARFMDNMKDGRVPTRFTAEGPIYYDFDGTLWLVDRLKEYLRYAGLERGLDFIKPRWTQVKGIVESYSRRLEDGLVKHKSGTWMDTLSRDAAVEVQGLWYNALNVIEEMSLLVNDPVDYLDLKLDFESSFMDKYWNGSYLNDCLGDSTLRPNQVIAVSLDYSVVPDRKASELMKVVEEELLTPCGLRTLDQGNPRYHQKYVGGVDERARAYHNGTVWPWLLGPYARAAVKLGGEAGRGHAMQVLEPLFTRLGEACIGSINEVFDGAEPHTPRGAVSQAWSVAEVLRSYYEDALGNRP